MRILHLFSMAGVAEIMCKYGAGDKVLQLREFDPFGFSDFYRVTELFDDPNLLVKRAVELKPEYDKIIIHDFLEFDIHFPADKILYVFHGGKLRGMADAQRESLKDKQCYVTTTDLCELLPNATYLPNPVDLEHFTYEGESVYGDKETWFCINRGHGREFIEKKIKEKYPETLYYERNKDSIIDYEDMPFFLSQYDNYVDWKFTYDHPPVTVPALSCTGLQAMAMGCIVHDHNGEVTDKKVLLIHDAKRVTERFLKDIEN